MDLRVDPWLLCRFFARNSCSWEGFGKPDVHDPCKEGGMAVVD